MLLASVRTIPGIHQRRPATLPSGLRKLKVALSLSTREAVSCVVAIQRRPMSGSLTSTTGPASRSRRSCGLGSRKKSSLVRSTSRIKPCPRDVRQSVVNLLRFLDDFGSAPSAFGNAAPQCQQTVNDLLRHRVHHRRCPLLDIEWLLSTLFDASLFNFPSRRPPAALFWRPASWKPYLKVFLTGAGQGGGGEAMLHGQNREACDGR